MKPLQSPLLIHDPALTGMPSPGATAPHAALAAFLAAVMFGSLVGVTHAQDRTGAIGVPLDSPAAASDSGLVAAAHPIASAAGAEILSLGGNAIDAAIATQFVLNVVEPTSSGIGGGGFMGVHLAESGRTFFIDSREKAPAAATSTQFLTCDPDCDDEADKAPEPLGGFVDVATSGIGVGVPGTLLGIEYALENYGSGSLTLADLLEPAIALARDGFPVNERLASLTASDRTGFWPETAAVFRTPSGEPLTEGFLLKQPELAATFESIAKNGVDAFYSGDLAKAIIKAQERSRDLIGPRGQGRMSLDDLAQYRRAGAVEREPISFDYRGFTLAGMPPPSSGGLTVAQILACLESFELGDVEAGFGPGSMQTLHVMIESMRMAFSSRSVWMGDMDDGYELLPTAGLIHPDYLKPRCEAIELDRRLTDEQITPGDPRAFDEAFEQTPSVRMETQPDGATGIDTTHFSVIDKAGNVVSWTSTIEGTWGSGMIVSGYGFLLNNELTDFNFAPQANPDPMNYKPGANDVAAGKRPRSSMAPTLLFKDDRFLAAYGSPGGSTIINSVVNMTVNLIDHRMSVQAAIDAPRISTSGGSVAYEAGFDAKNLDALTALGHILRDKPGDIGSVQAVVVDPESGMHYGGADSRRAGSVSAPPR